MDTLDSISQNLSQQQTRREQPLTHVDPNKPLSEIRETSDAIDMIFGTMPAIWPHFLKTYGTHDSTGVWKEALQGVPINLVKLALKRYTRVKSDFPPTPGQFYHACMEIWSVTKKRRQERQRDEAPTLTPRDECLYACRWHLTERIVGEFAKFIRKPKPKAVPEGFPMYSLVHGVKLRDTDGQSPLKLSETTAYYRELERRFNEAWAVYTDKGSS